MPSVRFEKGASASSWPAKVALPPPSFNGPKLTGPPAKTQGPPVSGGSRRGDGGQQGQQGTRRSRRRSDSASERVDSRSRRNSSRSRRRRRSSVSSVSPSKFKPPMCPNDLACGEINDQGHQAEYRHTCRRSSCEFLWMDEHRRLFVHTDTIDGPTRGQVYHIPERECPPCGPVAHTSYQDHSGIFSQQPTESVQWHDKPMQYGSRPMSHLSESEHYREGRMSQATTLPTQRQGARSPLRPPPRPVVDDGIFASRGGGPASDLPPPQPVVQPVTPPAAHRHGRAEGREVVRVRAASPHHSGDESELLLLRKRQEVLEDRIRRRRKSDPERRGDRHGTLEEIDQQLGERLHGFTLLKELDNLAMEVRTLRHLHHFRTPLTQDHDHATIAYQLDHSVRRVSAGVRRARHLLRSVLPDDPIQQRALDEITFAEELLLVVRDDDRAAMYPASAQHDYAPHQPISHYRSSSPPYSPPEGKPRLIHTSVSAAPTGGRMAPMAPTGP